LGEMENRERKAKGRFHGGRRREKSEPEGGMVKIISLFILRGRA